MCRLYALQATHSTRAACELLDAQNALLDQSQKDTRGLSNPHGWGMASLANSTAHCVRQVKPADESRRYRKQSLRLEGTTLLAHIRRATVGSPSATNTHPFRQGSAFLIHNGHVPAFEAVPACSVGSTMIAGTGSRAARIVSTSLPSCYRSATRHRTPPYTT